MTDLATKAELITWKQKIKRAAFAPKGQKKVREKELRDFTHKQMAQHLPRRRA